LISYWNNCVGVRQMGGHGSLSRRSHRVYVSQKADLATLKLPALLAYQLSLFAPPAPAGSFNEAAAEHGKILFNDQAGCATCNIPTDL
jgi:hypothetical protein